MPELVQGHTARRFGGQGSGLLVAEPGMTVLTAVTVAGGFTYRAIKSYGSILRTTNGKAVEGRVSRQTYVEPGDVITIYERHF